MYFHEGTTDFLKWLVVVVAGALFIWWIRHDFGANYALIAVILCAGTVFFILGSLLSAYIQKNTMNEISKFNAKDAMIDRYRAKTLYEGSKGNSWQLKAEAQKQLIDYKNEPRQLIDQRKQELKQLTQKPDNTFWESSETIDLEDWS